MLQIIVVEDVGSMTSFFCLQDKMPWFVPKKESWLVMSRVIPDLLMLDCLSSMRIARVWLIVTVGSSPSMVTLTIERAGRSTASYDYYNSLVQVKILEFWRKLNDFPSKLYLFFFYFNQIYRTEIIDVSILSDIIALLTRYSPRERFSIIAFVAGLCCFSTFARDAKGVPETSQTVVSMLNTSHK